MGKVRKSITKRRYAAFVAVCLVASAADFVIAPATDRRAAGGRGYGHHARVPYRNDPAYGALRGHRRVMFNFRHFCHWWTAWPAGTGLSPMALVTSDGNVFTTNFFGHFVVSFVLCLLGLVVVRRILPVAVAGTAINIFHEYVSEGQYADPSFIDLWLDQLGLLLAVIVFVAVRRSRKNTQALNVDHAVSLTTGAVGSGRERLRSGRGSDGSGR